MYQSWNNDNAGGSEGDAITVPTVRERCRFYGRQGDFGAWPREETGTSTPFGLRKGVTHSLIGIKEVGDTMGGQATGSLLPYVELCRSLQAAFSCRDASWWHVCH